MHELVKNLPGNGRFLYSAFSRFNSQDCQRFFEEAGLPLKVERGQRVFPVSDSAQDVVDVLMKQLHQAGVQLVLNRRVKALRASGEGEAKRVEGLLCEQTSCEADAIILATGGASYPLTGSTGDGYALAQSVGHTLVAPRGALVPQETVEEWPSRLQGLSLRNVRLSLFRGDKKIAEEFGEMLFTHFGVSGPIVLSLSRQLLDAEQQEYRFSINLKPALSPEQIDQRLQRDFQKNIRKQFKNALDELLPQKLIPVFIELSGISPQKPVHSITRIERQRIGELLTHLEMRIAKPRPISEAIVTAGGVAIREIEPKTMESKLCRGLYIVGELLDVDGYTGGFNLQAAFSSGYVAGQAAAQDSE